MKDMSEYYGRMKTLADALCDVGHPIQDSQLVLNLLRGLNPRFTTTADDIANSATGFPSFNQARDMLALKELRLANEEKVSNSTALLAGHASSSSGCPGECRPPAGHVQPSGSNTTGGSRSGSGGRTSGGGGSKKRWQHKKGGGGGFQAPSGNPRPTGPWFCFSPGANSYSAPGFQQAGSQGSGGWRP